MCMTFLHQILFIIHQIMRDSTSTENSFDWWYLNAAIWFAANSRQAGSEMCVICQRSCKQNVFHWMFIVIVAQGQNDTQQNPLAGDKSDIL